MSEVGELNAKYALAYPKQFAEDIGVYSSEEVASILALLPSSSALKVASYLPASLLVAMVESGQLAAAHLFADADTDDATLLLTKLPRDVCIAFVSDSTDKRVKRRLMRFLNYPPHSVGSLVSKPTLIVHLRDTIKSVQLAMQEERLHTEPSVLVVADNGAYLGVLDVWKILGASDAEQPLRELVDKVEPIFAEVEHSIAAQNNRWEERNWMPVVDHQGRVVGVLWRQNLNGEADQDRDTSSTLEQIFVGLVTDFFQVMTALINVMFGRGKL